MAYCGSVSVKHFGTIKANHYFVCRKRNVPAGVCIPPVTTTSVTIPIVLLVGNHICTSTIVHHVKPFLEGNYKNVILLEWTQVTKCLPPSARPFCCAVYFWLQNLPIVLPTWATSLVAVGTGSLAAETLCKLPTLAFLYEIILLLE